MIRISQQWRGMLLAACLVAGVAACGQKKADVPASVPSPAQPVAVTSVDVGRAIGGDKRLTDRTDSFAPNDVIYAVVLTSGSSANASLKARWTFEDGQLVDESEQAIAPTGDAATEFHVSKPDGWPKGKYKVEITLDGSAAGSKDFTVK